MHVILRQLWLLMLAVVPLAAYAGPGKDAYEEFVEQELIYPDEAWQDYVQQIGDRLLAVTPEPDRELHVYLLDTDSVNAMAFPDGYVFLHRGLLAHLESEDQLAAVIGHEIGHVIGAHARRRNLLGAFGSITGFVGAVLTGRGELMEVANAATATMTSGYGRELELEADELGGRYLAEIGYNPLAIIEVIQVLKDQEQFSKQHGGRQSYHGLFASHPKNDKRLHEAVQKSMSSLPAQLAEPVGDFWALMDGLTYGDEAATGVVRDSAYYHGSLRFVVEFPDGWDVSSTSSLIVGKAPDGSSAGLITLQRQDPVAGQAPEEYVKKTLQRDDIISGEATEINEFDAYVAELEPGGSATVEMLAVVYKSGGVFLFKGETAGDEAQFKEAFRATLDGFRNLTPADLREANSQRIQIVQAKPGDTYASLAAKTSLRDQPEQSLRLLNGDHPNGEPRAGDRIKIVQ